MTTDNPVQFGAAPETPEDARRQQHAIGWVSFSTQKLVEEGYAAAEILTALGTTFFNAALHWNKEEETATMLRDILARMPELVARRDALRKTRHH